MLSMEIARPLSITVDNEKHYAKLAVIMRLTDYLNLLDSPCARDFAALSGIHFVSLSQYLTGVRPTPPLDWCIKIEKATNRAVTCEELRPDHDWQFLRSGRCGSDCLKAA